MKTVTTVIFDLYGTLLRHNSRALWRDLSRGLGGRLTGSKDAMAQLLVRSYPDHDSRLRAWCAALGLEDPTESQLCACDDILKEHLDRITTYNGVAPLLAFLKRRGLKLGLLSNAADLFVGPLQELGLDDYFDAVVFSCEVGMVKPDPGVYHEACRRLESDPAECLFIGDSPVNDHAAPQSLGMRAILLRAAAVAPDRRLTIDHLGWMPLAGVGVQTRPMIFPGMGFEAFGKSWSVARLEFLPDSQQGRYNIVAKVFAADSSGEESEFYCKRYLLPESAHVEEAAYSVMDLLGLAGCQAARIPGAEPLLMMTKASGEPWNQEKLDASMIESIGQHCAAAYLIGNADLRPRNTLVDRGEESARLGVIDLEHCFFDRALDVSALDNPFDPRSVDRLNGTVEQLTKRRALSFAATRRCRRSFVPVADLQSPEGRSFQRGWRSVYGRAKACSRKISSLLTERIYAEPPLIVGTQAYRRALARVDVEDLLERIAADPDQALQKAY